MSPNFPYMCLVLPIIEIEIYCLNGIVPPSGSSSVKSGVHTLTPMESCEKPIHTLMEPENLRKNTIFNEHPVLLMLSHDAES